jgi:hypothetical protein
MLKIRNIRYTNGGAYHINLTGEAVKIPYIMQKGAIKLLTAVVSKIRIKIVEIWI